MPDALVMEMYKAAFIMRGATVLKGLKAVKMALLFPAEGITFSYLSSSLLWPDFFMLTSLLHLIKNLSFKESERGCPNRKVLILNPFCNSVYRVLQENNVKAPQKQAMNTETLSL